MEDPANQPDSDPAGADATGDDTLPPSEATDSDELRNADGDATVTAPEQWQAADESVVPDAATGAESLEDKLAAEEPDLAADQPARAVDDEEPSRRHRGQIDDTPEDGDSFFTVEE